MSEEKNIFDFIEKRPQESPDAAYFEELAKKVMQDSHPTKTKLIPLYKRPILWISGAAAAVLLLLFMNRDLAQVDLPQIDFNDVSKSEILAYVDANIDEFDEELLLEFIPENRLEVDDIQEELQKIEVTTTRKPKDTPLSNSIESLSKEDIFEYLEDEELDLLDLEEDIFQ